MLSCPTSPPTAGMDAAVPGRRGPAARERAAAAVAAALLALLASIGLGACARQAATPVASAAVAARAPLNSERIAARFGSYGIEVLESDARVRVSNLYSTHEGRRVTRTLAVVRFPPAIDPRVAAEHALVVAGGSIGATFAERGWTVTRRPLLVGEVPGPAPGDRLRELMALSGEAPLALEVYALLVARGGVSVEYATIAEVHHPEHLALADLRALHGRDVPGDASGSAPLLAILELVARAARAPLAPSPAPAAS